jgi:hypothetical protein
MFEANLVASVQIDQTYLQVLDAFRGEKLGNLLFQNLHRGCLEIPSIFLLDDRKDKGAWGIESVEIEGCQNGFR